MPDNHKKVRVRVRAKGQNVLVYTRIRICPLISQWRNFSAPAVNIWKNKFEKD